MDRLYRTLVLAQKLRPRRDDDFIDKLHYWYTTLMLVMGSIIVSMRLHIGDPVQCWTPSHFTASQNRYASTICWISNTYRLPNNKEIPENIVERINSEIIFYQWVPLVFLLQMVCFQTPCLVWTFASGHSGFRIKAIVDLLQKCDLVTSDSKSKVVSNVTTHFMANIDCMREYRSGRFTRFRHRLAKTCCLVCGRRYGNALSAWYLTVKSLYAVNAMLQLYLINFLLIPADESPSIFGVRIIYNLFLRQRTWEPGLLFPRVTFCDFEIRQLGNVHRHTVQCALPINIFNEKIFIFLWFWLAALFVFTVFSLCSWSIAMTEKCRVGFVKKMLVLSGVEGMDKRLLRQFVVGYLRMDAVFVMLMINKTCGDALLMETIKKLWDKYRKRFEAVKLNSRDPSKMPLTDNDNRPLPPVDSNRF